MSLSQTLASAGLIRTTNRRGFCPACRFLFAAPAGDQPGGEVELAPPAFAALAFLAVAAIAWALVVRESRSSGDMELGVGSFEPFTASWAVMMAAMMLPSATPLVVEFARTAEGRRGWHAATGMLGATYLSIWLVFGIACYLVLSALPMSWTDERLAGGVALGLAGLYGLTPLKRASEARCRELCALHGPLPFNLMREAVLVGANYGVSCVGCSAALMVAMVLVGMSSLVWVVILGGIVLVYKLAPAPARWQTLLLSASMGALGAVFALST
jgi:predicted metal-binding membrane protein